MSGSTAKIHLRIGQLEVECEGSESFLKDDLPNLVNKMRSSLVELGAEQVPDSPPDVVEAVSSTGSSRVIDVSAATIASRMDAKTAPDLAIAASAYFTLVKGQDSYSRAEILEAMKDATAYYNTNMSSNLSATLKSLVRNKRLNETASGTYALTANERENLEKLIADHQ